MSTVSKLHAKQTLNASITLSVLTRIGVSILKKSGSASLAINGEPISDETVGTMLLANIKNEISKGGVK